MENVVVLAMPLHPRRNVRTLRNDAHVRTARVDQRARHELPRHAFSLRLFRHLSMREGDLVAVDDVFDVRDAAVDVALETFVLLVLPHLEIAHRTPPEENVSQPEIRPESNPRLNHSVRCSEEPCVNESGLPRLPAMRCSRSSPTAAAA